MARCSFCSSQIGKGIGKIFVFKSGRTANFCSSKCEKNMLKLGRKARDLKWAS